MFNDFVKNCYDELVGLELTLCRIPSPSHHEHNKAVFVKDWLSEYGNAYIDEADNVIFTSFDNGCEDAYLICAHTDTVFPDTEPFDPVIKDGRLYCPGAGDDTLNLAAMMLYVKYLSMSNARPKVPVIFAANTCEEGLGNLKGSKQLIKDFGHRLAGFISFDGGFNEVTNAAVGSHRYKVTVETPGGHSYGSFGNRNAIAELSSLISDLYSVEVPKTAKTTYNVGTIEGGTSVNTIAQKASMLYEYRSEDATCLEYMKSKFEQATAKIAERETVKISVETVGIRPCAEEVDTEKEEKLTKLASECILRVIPDIKLMTGASSTDCNIPLSVGIPAVSFGLYNGHGAHTREEYIELDSLAPGFKIGAELMEELFTID